MTSLPILGSTQVGHEHHLYVTTYFVATRKGVALNLG